MRKSGQTNYVNYGELRKIKGVTTIIKADVAGKQNRLSDDQLAAVNSGITAQVLADLQLRLISAEEKAILDLLVYNAENHTLGIKMVDDNPIHFWTYGDVIAGGDGEGGGSGTSGTLYGCTDVTAYNNMVVGRDTVHPAQAGDILTYDGTHWHAAEAPATGVTGIKVNGGNVLTGEVGLTIPTALSQLSDDTTHRLVTDTQINSWATQNFVNSSIATATATFRGTSAAGLTESQFLSWANGLTHDNNDYVFWSTVDLDGNVQYKRYKYNGSNWVFEYTLNNSSFTSAQWAAINSGFDADDLTKLAGIADGAQVNVLESVKLNGAELSNTNKAVNVNAATAISVPTGFVAGSLTSSGSIAIGFSTGYSILSPAQKAILDLLVYNAENHTLGIKMVDDNPIHFWTYGDVIAGGDGEGGGSGTSGTLYGCTDVTAYNNTVVGRDTAHPAQAGDILAYDGTHWYAITPPETGVASLGGATGAIGLASNLTISNGVLSGNYSDATTTAHGLMSATDKAKLNGIASGATAVSSSTVLGWGFVKKVCSKSPDSNGNVALTASDVGALSTQGGTLSKANTTSPLSISAPAMGNISYIGYYNGSTNLGGIGVSASNTPAFRNTGGTWYTLYHSGNLTAATLGAETTAHASQTYVAKAGDTMTGLLSLATGVGLNDATGNGLLVYHPTSWTGASSSQWGVGAIDSQGVIRSGNADLIHYKAGTNCTIYDSSNLSKSTLGLGNVDNTADANKIVARANYADVLRDPSYHDTSHRRTSANINWADGGLHYYLATSSMTEGKPTMGDGHILHMSWDNGSWEGQLVIPSGATGDMQWRTMNGGTWGGWNTIYDNHNCNNTSTAWSASSLTLNGAISGATTITASGYITAQGVTTQASANYTPLSSYISGSRKWQIDTVGGDFRLYMQGASAYVFNVLSGGNVGFGTTNPSEKVQLVTTSTTESIYGQVVKPSNGGGDAGWSVTNGTHNIILMIGGGNVNRGIYDRYMNKWLFYTDNNYIYLNHNVRSDWNMGLSVNPVSKLHIYQTAYDNGITLQRSVSEGGSGIMFMDGSSTRLGVFGINGSKQFEFAPYSDATTRAIVFMVDASGNARANGDVAAGSDARWKHNITDVLNGIDAIMKLQPSEWLWNSDDHKGSGLIAQEVRGVLPHLVKEDGEGYLHLTYDGLHAYEISALQSHETRIATLERENRELKAQIARLSQ